MYNVPILNNNIYDDCPNNENSKMYLFIECFFFTNFHKIYSLLVFLLKSFIKNPYNH